MYFSYVFQVIEIHNDFLTGAYRLQPYDTTVLYCLLMTNQDVRRSP